MVGPKFFWINVGPDRNGTFDLVKCQLSFFAPENLEPLQCFTFVRSSRGQSKSVPNHDEAAFSSGKIHPAEILVVLQVCFLKLSVSPIAHHAESTFTFDHLSNGLIPTESRMIRIFNFQQ